MGVSGNSSVTSMVVGRYRSVEKAEIKPKGQTKNFLTKSNQKRPNLTYLALREAKWQPWENESGRFFSQRATYQLSALFSGQQLSGPFTVHTYVALACAGLRCAVLPVFSRTSSWTFIITIVQYYSKKASHAVAGKPRDAAVNFKRYEVQ